MLKQAVGLDIAKDKVAACFAQQERDKAFRIRSTRSFRTDAAGLQQLGQWIDQQRGAASCPLVAHLEATGVYYEETAYWLYEHGYALSVSLPNKTKAYARSLNHKSKTDAIDASMLAQMALERDLMQWSPPSPNMLTLKRLCRERIELQHDRTVMRNRLHAKKAAHAAEADSLERAAAMLAFLHEQLKAVEKAIAQAVAADAAVQARVVKLRSIKGVGLLTAATILAETDGFALFHSKAQVVSYAGLDVVQEQSGTSLNRPGHISKKGNAHLRRALYFPALTAVRHEPELTELYDRVVRRTGINMKGVVAVQRKLLVLLYTLTKKDTVYDPQYAQKQNRQELCPA